LRDTSVKSQPLYIFGAIFIQKGGAMDDKDYLVTVKFPFKAMDDIDARAKALAFINEHGLDDEEAGVVLKLQKTSKSGPPAGMEL
jgi:hypothetical protein